MRQTQYLTLRLVTPEHYRLLARCRFVEVIASSATTACNRWRLHEGQAGRFALTSVGNHLRTGASGSMRAAALLLGGIIQRAWGDLRYSIETGEPAFRRVFGQD